MNDFDRYDFAISMLVGLLIIGAMLIGAPLWVLPLPLAIGVTISLYRHLPLPPHGRSTPNN